MGLTSPGEAFSSPRWCIRPFARGNVNFLGPKMNGDFSCDWSSKKWKRLFQHPKVGFMLWELDALRTASERNCTLLVVQFVPATIHDQLAMGQNSKHVKTNHSKSHWTLESDPPLVIWRLGSSVPLRSRLLTSMKIWCCRLPLLAASRICCADVNCGGYSLETTAKIMKLGHSLSPPLPLSS